MALFANRNILLTPSGFMRQCKMNIQNFHFCKHCHIRCHINWIHSIWCCILTRIFFWLNNGRNTDPYITKLSSLSNTREYDDDPEGALSSWLWPILFLPYQRNVMDHSWVLAMNHICENKKPCLYVHKKIVINLPRLLIPY